MASTHEDGIAVRATERVPLASLKGYPGNPRRGDVSLIVESLRAHGQYRALVVNRRTMEVLAGNHTFLALKEIQATEALVHFVEVDDQEARKITLVDNRANDAAGYDDKALLDLLKNLDGDLFGSGYDEKQLARMIAADERAQIDRGGAEPGELPAKPTTKPGDLYRLGDHRLLCGDATSAADIDKLMDGAVAELLLTDPPYGVNYDGGPRPSVKRKYRAIEGDTTSAGALGATLLEPALRLACEVSAPGAAAYVFHGEGTAPTFRRAFEEAGWGFKQVLIWVKQQLVLGRSDYHGKHEPILYGWKPGAAHRWFGGFNQTTVIDDDWDLNAMSKPELQEALREIRDEQITTVLRYDRPRSSLQHPTMKPVALCSRMISNSSVRGDVVIDPFVGSGSTFLAGSNLGRRVYGVEIDPAYCDVAVKRWEDHTRKVAELVE